MDRLHSILERQLKRLNIDVATLSPDVIKLLQAVSQTYRDFDEDHVQLNKSLELSSQEFFEKQKEITEALEKYQTLVNNLSIGAFRTALDDPREVQEMNPALTRMLDLNSKEEFMKMNIQDFYKYPEDKAEIIEKLKKVGFIKNYEVEMKSAKGRDFIALTTVIVRKDKNGRMFAEGYVEDITERKKAEEALKEAHDLLEARVVERTKELEIARSTLVDVLEDLNNQKRRLQLEKAKDDAILASIGDGVLVVSLEGNVIFINTAAQKMLGLSDEDILNKSVTVIKAENRKGEPIQLEQRPPMLAMSMKQPVYFSAADPIFFYKKDDTRFPVALVATPTFLDEKLLGAVVVFRDITKELEVDQAKNEFISIASHEIRTPLTVIDGVIAMMRSGEYGEIGDNLRQPLADVNTSSERLIHLINDLLSISRIQAGRLKYALSEFPISDKINYVVKLLQPAAQQRNIALRADHIDNAIVQSDQDKCEQILDNLIGNSLKFTDTGEIELSTKTVDGVLEITVRDTGIGIAKGDHGRLFRQFEQIQTDKNRPIGTGLGLYISREMARKMGGDVYLLESEPGKGSIFVFSLPLAGTDLSKKVKVDLIDQGYIE